MHPNPTPHTRFGSGGALRPGAGLLPAAGLLLGGGLAWLVTWLTPVPASIPLWAVAASLSAAVITGMGFGLFPALRASRLDPVVALRHE